MVKKEVELLKDFIHNKRLRETPQRIKVLDVFLATERHISAEELHKLVSRRYEGIGYTTVYRTMKLLSQAGLCTEVDFGDGIIRYEHNYNHSHHDHLICTECGRFIEVFDHTIEELQDKLAKRFGFLSERHRLQIFGLCNKCRGRK